MKKHKGVVRRRGENVQREGEYTKGGYTRESRIPNLIIPLHYTLDLANLFLLHETCTIKAAVLIQFLAMRRLYNMSTSAIICSKWIGTRDRYFFVLNY